QDLTIAESTKHTRKEMICWQFWELIHQHCHQERAVAFYANLLSITPYYLSQLTQDLFNDAPKTLIDRQVILEIKKLLTQTKQSIEAIADTMNFNDPSYLCRYFKRHTGISLSQYRKTGLK
ncbi:MAG: helix-turn-helix domain-containing protein, partial [Wohlfahrtiimonas sp.]